MLSARARLSRGRAVVSVQLRARDRDACNGRIVRQYFRGRWLLAPRGDDWVAVRVTIRKTRGGRVRLSKSECDGGDGEVRKNCDPNYSGCLDPNAVDYDCAGGSGDGPNYTGQEVLGNDHYGPTATGTVWAARTRLRRSGSTAHCRNQKVGCASRTVAVRRAMR